MEKTLPSPPQNSPFENPRETEPQNQDLAKIIRLAKEQHPHLECVQTVFIPPVDEPNTGGFFNTVVTEDRNIVPTIFIVSEENGEHTQNLMSARQASAKMASEMLGISFKDMSPRLLKMFIIAHELGHAADYVINYLTNPEYKNTNDADEAWNLHYVVNLYSLPIPELDPPQLSEELERAGSLSRFIQMHPESTRTIEINQVKTSQDLLNLQEHAYRASIYEQYADNFATAFLKRNAEALDIPSQP